MNATNVLADRFEEHRDHLRAVAYRMLGSLSEADDAVQEAWLKYDRTDTSDVENIGGWSVVADSAAAFQSVRDASTGSSLADNADFKSAMSQVGGSSFATAYASGSGVEQLPAKLRALVRVAGSPRWVAAGITADKSALHLDVRAAGASTPAAYKPALLNDVPSGAILAVSFKDVNQLLARIQALLRRASGTSEPTQLVVGDLEFDNLSAAEAFAAAIRDLWGRIDVIGPNPRARVVEVVESKKF